MSGHGTRRYRRLDLVKKRRDESQDDLDDNFNVAEDEETNADGHKKDGINDADDEDADEVAELGQGDMLSGEFDADDNKPDND